jgi:hypothetical protein
MKDIPAFPRPHSGATQYAQEGMTLRDYFAAAALVGVETITNKKDLANYCYQVADEMMKARQV